jgi:hypothetical protein
MTASLSRLLKSFPFVGGRQRGSQMDSRAADGKLPIDDFSAKPRKYFIGIDVGTESARACVVDDEGCLLGSAFESIRQWHSQPGFFVCLQG